MSEHIEITIPKRPGSWVIAALFAIAGAHAQTNGQAQVQDYRPVFQACRSAAGAQRLAIRRMEIDGTKSLLQVDPETLATGLEPAAKWSCADTSDEQQQQTRYLRAIRAATAPRSQTPPSGVIANGGLVAGPPTGAFITGDLCPSRSPLDRAFLQNLEAQHSPLPVALSISGTWLTHHRADFEWLVGQQRSGGLQITWVDHSYHHPYTPGRPLAEHFLLTPGIDAQSEILDTERVLIANHQTPSTFFRFPGLISNPALMQLAAADHLIVLGAAAWLARTPRARPGDIILIHLNGNEPAGLAIFSKLLAAGKLPQHFNPIAQAP